MFLCVSMFDCWFIILTLFSTLLYCLTVLNRGVTVMLNETIVSPLSKTRCLVLGLVFDMNKTRDCTCALLNLKVS